MSRSLPNHAASAVLRPELGVNHGALDVLGTEPILIGLDVELADQVRPDRLLEHMAIPQVRRQPGARQRGGGFASPTLLYSPTHPKRNSKMKPVKKSEWLRWEDESSLGAVGIFERKPLW